MSAIAPIVINDGKATPVAHTFYPGSPLGGVIRYREQISGIPYNAQASIGILQRFDERNISAVNKTRIVMEIPVQEVAGSANSQGYTAQPKVAFSEKIICEVFSPGRGDSPLRKDARVMFWNLMAHAAIIDLIDNQVGPY